jgi:atypical dual specificity phosphatase
MGISRSATIVCAYLIAEQGLTAAAAVDFVRERRPIICPNVGFRRQLGEYSTKLHGTREDGETQSKSTEVPKNIRDFRLWMRGVMSKKKEIDSLAS